MSDAFDDAFALLTAAADVKGFEARITRLKKLSEQVAAEQAQVAADRETHHRELAAAEAATNAREARLRDREVKVGIAERDLIAREERVRDARQPRFDHDPNLSGSITQGQGRYPNGR
jgi:hypothetical protein